MLGAEIKETTDQQHQSSNYLDSLYERTTKNKMAEEAKVADDGGSDLPECDVKVILLGDSAVGKSKLVERFLMDDYNPRQLSTYALTLFRKNCEIEGIDKAVKVDFWDTAGQERFNKMHPSYYYKAHVCILVFDVTRKQVSELRMRMRIEGTYTYTNKKLTLNYCSTHSFNGQTYTQLKEWYRELREYCEHIPVILVANKIDVDYQVTKKNFKFAAQNNLPFYFVSAADGTNIVKVFEEAIKAGLDHKERGPEDFVTECLELFGDDEGKQEEKAKEEMKS